MEDEFSKLEAEYFKELQTLQNINFNRSKIKDVIKDIDKSAESCLKILGFIEAGKNKNYSEELLQSHGQFMNELKTKLETNISKLNSAKAIDKDELRNQIIAFYKSTDELTRNWKERNAKRMLLFTEINDSLESKKNNITAVYKSIKKSAMFIKIGAVLLGLCMAILGSETESIFHEFGLNLIPGGKYIAVCLAYILGLLSYEYCKTWGEDRMLKGYINRADYLLRKYWIEIESHFRKIEEAITISSSK